MSNLPLLIGPHQAPVYALAHGMQQSLLYSAGGDRIVALWDIISGEQQPFTVRTDASVFALCYDNNSQLLFIACSNGKLHAVDVHSKQEAFAWSLDAEGIFDLKMDVLRNRLLVAGGNGILTVIELASLKVVRSIALSNGKLRRLALDENNHLLAVADNAGPIHVLDAETFQTIETIHSHAEGATAVAWHPSKPVLVSGGKDAFIRCHSIAEGYKEIFAFAAHLSTIYDIVYNRSSNRFVTCSRDKTIKWWDPANFDPLRKVSHSEGGHKHSVNRLLTAGVHTISASDDRQVLVFGV